MFKCPGIAALLAIALYLFIPSTIFGQTSAPKGYSVTAANPARAMEADVLALVNKYRQGKGMQPLQPDPEFSREALKHSQAMAEKKTPFSHDGFEDRVKRLTKLTGPIRMSAENVAFGQLSANEVVANWLKSPGHKRNIEGKYSVTGIGIYEAKDGTLFFTQIFGAR